GDVDRLVARAVEHHDVVALLGAVRGQVPADEPAAPCDQHLHAAAPARAACAYASTCCSAHRSHVNDAARAGPAAHSRAANEGSSSTRAIASASPLTSSSGATAAALSTTSPSADPAVVTTGAPHARPSSAGRPKPSSNDGYATTSARRNRAGITPFST